MDMSEVVIYQPSEDHFAWSAVFGRSPGAYTHLWCSPEGRPYITFRNGCQKPEGVAVPPGFECESARDAFDQFVEGVLCYLDNLMARTISWRSLPRLRMSRSCFWVDARLVGMDGAHLIVPRWTDARNNP